MFCKKCGKSIDSNEKICSNCGHKNFNNGLDYNIKKSYYANKKRFISLVCGFIIIFLLVVLFCGFYGFSNLKWDESYEILNEEYSSATMVTLGIDYSDNVDKSEIKISTNCGEFEIYNKNILWDLTAQEGECEIEISYKWSKISKTFQIVTNKDTGENEEILGGYDYEIDYESDDDIDYDGLTNKEETSYGTNVELMDTDMDGLDDYYEIFESFTDPLIKDSDEDGLSDYSEIELGLDPLNSDSYNDGINDSDRNLSYVYDVEGISININGSGNIADITAVVNENIKISSKTGLIDKVYSFYTEGSLENAVITIDYTDEELEEYDIDENNLTLYYYNEEDMSYEIIDTIVDAENNTITVTLNHFSNYVLGDSELFNVDINVEVLFVLDNSWSMYTKEQYSDITGTETNSSGLDGNDEDGLRFTLTESLISSLIGFNYNVGLSEFRGTYANVLQIGSSESDLSNSINSMYGNFVSSLEGTDITNALNGGISEFSDDASNKYLIILTDGEDTGLYKDAEEIITNAKTNDISICAIGFGDGSSNEDLAYIAEETGCKLYSASDSNGLYELFGNIEVELSDDLVDIDKDDEIDGILIADSGFIVNRDGFSFKNYSSNLAGGHCYGMATFAQLYYSGDLPLEVDSMNYEATYRSYYSYAYDLSDSYFSDGGNLYDYQLETNELKYMFNTDYFGESNATSYYTKIGNTLSYNSEAKSAINSSGLYDIKTNTSTLDSESQYKKYGVSFEKIEVAFLNEDSMQTSSEITDNDLQLFNAILTAYNKQVSNTIYTSGLDLKSVLITSLTASEFGWFGKTTFINILTSRLNNGEAIVIGGYLYNEGGHAVNAISLIQDIENPNYYYISVYDNNYPGETRYVDIECNLTSCVTVANEYYDGSGSVIEITGSLEDDLSYYS